MGPGQPLATRLSLKLLKSALWGEDLAAQAEVARYRSGDNAGSHFVTGSTMPLWVDWPATVNTTVQLPLAEPGITTFNWFKPGPTKPAYATVAGCPQILAVTVLASGDTFTNRPAG